MKKTLIALAAIAAVSSAMADVSITGYFDRAVTNLNSTDATKNLTSVASSAGTTGIFFKGSESLGNGLTAMFSIENDFVDAGGATQTQNVNQNQKAGFANGEVYVGLASADMGSVKLGAPNNFTLDNVTNYGQPGFKTGMGSIYSTKFSVANGIGTGTDGNSDIAVLAANGATDAGGRAIRMLNTVQYSSPSFNGITFGVGFTPQNNNATAASGNGNTVGATEYAIKYNTPKFNAQYTSISYVVGSNGTSQIASSVGSAPVAACTTVLTSTTCTTTNVLGASTNTLAANLKSTQNYLGANYALTSQITVYGGYSNFSSSDNLSQGRGVNAGASYTMGQTVFMANVAQVTDSNSVSQGYNRSLTGLGIDYNFSKMTKAYARYDSYNLSTNVAATANSGSQVSRSAVGLAISF
jgi:predicted porin